MKTFIEQLLQEETDDEFFNTLLEFVLDLDESMLDESMQERYFEILDTVDSFGLEDEEMEEAKDEDGEPLYEAVKKVKINKAERMKRKKLYRSNKSKIKLAAARYRKSAAYKAWKKKAKKMGAVGKTAAGKKKVTYV